MEGDLTPSECLIYRPLSANIISSTGVVENKDLASSSVNEFLEKTIPKDRFKDLVNDDLRYKVFYLDNNKERRKSYNHEGKRKNKLTRKEKKQLDIFKIEKEQKYDDFLQLNNLWDGYINELLKTGNCTDSSIILKNAAFKLLKADLHGALISVTRSKCPNLIGITGILIMETKHTFKIVTKENKVKVVPKSGSNFTIQVLGYVFTLYGNKFMQRPTDRLKKTHKIKPTIDM